MIFKKHQVKGGDELEQVFQYFKLFRLPSVEESFANKDIPDEHNSLKDTVSEASFCLSFKKCSGSYSVQTCNTNSCKGYTWCNWQDTSSSIRMAQNKLSIDLAEIFHDNAKIIKDIGNQEAHPDDDVTLHNFTKEVFLLSI